MMKPAFLRSRSFLLALMLGASLAAVPAAIAGSKAQQAPAPVPAPAASTPPELPPVQAASNPVVVPGTAPAAQQLPATIQTGAAVVGTAEPKKEKELPQRTEFKDPCPLPEGLNTSGMSDLARIQEDIDRYTLCIQRADLLAQLNETETKNKAAFDEALGLGDGAAMTGADAPMPPAGLRAGNIPPVSESALGIDVAPNGTGATAHAARADAPVSSAWQVDSVLGSGRALKAVLVTSDGMMRRVQVGDELPNGDGKLVAISASDVKLQKGKTTISLPWAEKTSASGQKGN